MSVEEMTMVTVSGPEKMVNTAIQNLVINKEFHPENAIKLLSGVKELVPFDTPNPYSEALAKSLSLMRGLGVTPDYRDFEGKEWKLLETTGYLNGLATRYEDLQSERELEDAVIKNNATAQEQLSHFIDFKVDLSDLFTMRYLKFHFGRLPSETYKECMAVIDGRPDVYFVTSGSVGHWMYGAYFCLPDATTQVEAIFASLGFERIHIDVEGDVNNTAQEVLERLKTETARATAHRSELDEACAAIGRDEAEKLLLTYSWLRYQNDSFEICSYAGRRHGKFYLIGWIPKADAEEFVAHCEAIRGFACFLTKPEEVKQTPPPVKFKKNWLADIYQPYIEMYGVPSYGELDPRLFMAITYTFIFGIMFGDLGQGFCLVVLGLYLWKSKGKWLGRILAMCGGSAMVFGCIYGSVFGNEELLPWAGYKAIDHSMDVLLYAVVFGIALIVVCMLLNIINGIRMKDRGKALFSPNGLAGMVFYVGIILGVFFLAAKKQNIFTGPYIWLVIVLPLVLLFLSGPLTKLVNGEKDWKPESVGMFFVEGFFELFEVCLSYVSNTISFLRIGAYAISHAGMMLVVFNLAHNTNIVGIAFGNVLVAVLEALLVSIQVMRLEYYEMFGRFYEGGGTEFAPKIIDYKAAQQ